MIWRWVLVGAAAGAAMLVGAAAHSASPAADPVVGAAVVEGGVAARPLTFTGPAGERVTGEMLAPASPRKGPGVLYVHWLGDPATSNHTEFEGEARALAAEGATAILIDMPWSDRAWIRAVGKDATADLAQGEASIAVLGRAIDVLASQPGVDVNRIGLVGHDFGGMAGAVLSARDARVQALVFIAGNSSLADWYRFGKPQPDHAAYAAKLAPLDPLAAMRASKARARLLQFAAHDDYIPAANAEEVAAAAPKPTTVMTYDADHALAVPKAREDRLAFLRAQLF